MFREDDYNGKGLTPAARIAWVAVAFMLLFVMLPALTMSMGGTNRTVMSEPSKTVHSGPLYCYSDTVNHMPKLICDPPENPTR